MNVKFQIHFINCNILHELTFFRRMELFSMCVFLFSWIRQKDTMHNVRSTPHFNSTEPMNQNPRDISLGFQFRVLCLASNSFGNWVWNGLSAKKNTHPQVTCCYLMMDLVTICSDKLSLKLFFATTKFASQIQMMMTSIFMLSYFIQKKLFSRISSKMVMVILLGCFYCCQKFRCWKKYMSWCEEKLNRNSLFKKKYML